jgi:hypothetical protein
MVIENQGIPDNKTERDLKKAPSWIHSRFKAHSLIFYEGFHSSRLSVMHQKLRVVRTSTPFLA